MQIRFQDHDQTVMDPALKLEFPLRSRLGTRIRSSGLLCQRQHFTRQAIDLGKERLLPPTLHEEFQYQRFSSRQ
jgi:hypothetical protein